MTFSLSQYTKYISAEYNVAKSKPETSIGAFRIHMNLFMH